MKFSNCGGMNWSWVTKIGYRKKQVTFCEVSCYDPNCYLGPIDCVSYLYVLCNLDCWWEKNLEIPVYSSLSLSSLLPRHTKPNTVYTWPVPLSVQPLSRQIEKEVCYNFLPHHQQRIEGYYQAQLMDSSDDPNSLSLPPEGSQSEITKYHETKAKRKQSWLLEVYFIQCLLYLHFSFYDQMT